VRLIPSASAILTSSAERFCAIFRVTLPPMDLYRNLGTGHFRRNLLVEQTCRYPNMTSCSRGVRVACLPTSSDV